MKNIGNCPFCEGKISQKEVKVMNKNIKLYICENNKQFFNEDSEEWEISEDSTCEFKVFSNNLKRYGKGSISEKEMKEFLREKELKVRLYSKKLYNEEKGEYGNEYFRYIIPHKEYGIEVLFD